MERIDEMVLQERDYTKFISEEEQNAYELEERIASRKGIKNNREFPRFSHPDERIRDFLWHKISLFPNNYLHFLEYKKLDFDEEADNYHKIIYEAGLWLDSGKIFGKTGEGFERINVACPRAVLQEALDRIQGILQ